jgi:hypothetical protein
MDVNILMSAVTLGAVVIGAIVNITGLVGKRESKAAAEATLAAKLDAIYNKVDNIERKQSSMDDMMLKYGERLTAVEASAKSAHHRIDNLEKRERP